MDIEPTDVDNRKRLLMSLNPIPYWCPTTRLGCQVRTARLDFRCVHDSGRHFPTPDEEGIWSY